MFNGALLLPLFLLSVIITHSKCYQPNPDEEFVDEIEIEKRPPELDKSPIGNQKFTHVNLAYEHLINTLLEASGHPYELVTTDYPKSYYDYIIIGAGSAGSTVAARLAENPKTSVLVVEAGGTENNLTQYTGDEVFWLKSRIVVNIDGEPQKYAARSMKGRKIPIPIGIAVGGGSSHNAMVYNRGSRHDYDKWAELGAKGWSYCDVFPYFLKSEGIQHKGSSAFDNSYHAHDGPLTISGSPKPSYGILQLRRGLEELGFKFGDFNGHNSSGVFNYPQYNIRDGLRVSTGKAFLGPASRQPNVDVVIKAYVTKVLINDKNEAIGVAFIKGSTKYTIMARKEVIISAGPYNTPKILMLSGIGPSRQLEKFGIKVVKHLPGVGQNLQYHPQTEIYYEIDYIPKDSVGGILGHVRTKFAPDQRPDVELEFFHSNDGVDYSFHSKMLDYNDDFAQKYLIPFSFTPRIHVVAIGGRCYSPGEVRLKSKDPFQQAYVDHKLYHDERDLRAVIEALKIANDIMQTKAVKRYLNAKPYPNNVPGCEQFPLNSDKFYECFARTITSDANHPCCTAKIGSKDDPFAVVDPELRVYGVHRLRVVDSSVWPEVVSGNTNAPSIMVGEKAADIIKGLKMTSE